MKLDNWQIESESNLCVVFQGGEDLRKPTKLEHGILVRVELVERLRFISLTTKTHPEEFTYKESRSSEDNTDKPHGFS